MLSSELSGGDNYGGWIDDVTESELSPKAQSPKLRVPGSESRAPNPGLRVPCSERTVKSRRWAHLPSANEGDQLIRVSCRARVN